MLNVVLSGGDLGGTVVQWPEHLDAQDIEGYIYCLISDSQAVFTGPAN